jgi:putative membrane protein insertion efficiency factor
MVAQMTIGGTMNRIATAIALYFLRAYKWAMSPIFSPACRYVPTCSEYAAEAVARYGAWSGGLMSIKRVFRCHPMASSGYDPVVKPKDSNARGGCVSASKLCCH